MAASCGLGKRIRGQARAVEQAATSLDVAVHLGQLPSHPLEIADPLPEGRAVPRILDRFLECTLGQAERDAGVETPLGVECGKQLAESVLAQDHVLERQLAVLEADLGEILAAHRVIACSHVEARRVPVDQHAPDALAPGPAIDAAEHHEPFCLVGPADQRLDAIERGAVSLDRHVGPVVRHVRPRVRLGHAHGEQRFAGAHLGQDLALHVSRHRSGAGLGAALPYCAPRQDPNSPSSTGVPPPPSVGWFRCPQRLSNRSYHQLHE